VASIDGQAAGQLIYIRAAANYFFLNQRVYSQFFSDVFEKNLCIPATKPSPLPAVGLL
jgi:hypothetical protein